MDRPTLSSLRRPPAPVDRPVCQRAVLVLGMHRSGTSALARGLATLGVELGDDLLAGLDDNPDGYFEDRQVVATSQRLLQLLGIDWDSVAPVAAAEWQRDEVRRLQAEIAVDLRQRFGERRLWGFKDPRVMRTLPFWLGVLDHLEVDTQFVLSVRNPLSVAHSLLQRNGIAPEKGVLLWLVHWLPHLERLRDRPLVVVDYDRLLGEPQGQWQRLAERLGQAAPDGVPAFLTERRRHWSFVPVDLALDPRVSALARRAYERLRALAEDRGSPDDGFWSDWRALAAELEDLAPVWRYLDRSERERTQATDQLSRQQARGQELETHAAALQTRVQELETRATALAQAEQARSQSLAALEHTAADLRAYLEQVLASRSWRITTPLRAANAAVLTARARLFHDRRVLRGLSMLPVPGRVKARARARLGALQEAAGAAPASPSPLVAGDWPARVAARAQPMRVLVITDWLPQAQKNSSGLRLFTLLKLLREAGREVALLLRHDRNTHRRWADHAGEVQEGEAALATLGIPIVWGHELEDGLWRLGPRAALVLLSFPEPAHALLPLVRASAPWATVIYDMMDFHATRFDREAQVKGDPALAARATEYRRMELALVASCDLTLAISDDERRQVLACLPDAPVEVLPNIHHCVTEAAPLAGRDGLFFIGHFLHSPNEDAVLYFIEEILPLVLRECPQAVLRVAGSNIGERLRARSHPSVELLGYVPDAQACFDRARMFVAPLRFGAGMKGKVGQSLSLGLPVVTTPIGAEGMGLIDGENALIADDPQAFAAAVVRLYRDDGQWQTLSANGLALMRERFSEQAAAHTLARVLAQVEHGEH